MCIDSYEVTQRIKHIRKSKRIKIKDCAKILGFSKEAYQSVENGSRSLTLPELELLAFYLGVLPTTLCQNDNIYETYPPLLKKDIRPHYLSLRRKMISTLLSSILENSTVSFEDLQQATQIPEDILRAYLSGESPIPLDDLLKISDILEIPQKSLYEPVWLTDSSLEKPWLEHNWGAEFLKESGQEPTNEDETYKLLLQGLKQLSKSDQVYIAKTIFEKLKG